MWAFIIFSMNDGFGSSGSLRGIRSLGSALGATSLLGVGPPRSMIGGKSICLTADGAQNQVPLSTMNLNDFSHGSNIKRVTRTFEGLPENLLGNLIDSERCRYSSASSNNFQTPPTSKLVTGRGRFTPSPLSGTTYTTVNFAAFKSVNSSYGDGKSLCVGQFVSEVTPSSRRLQNVNLQDIPEFRNEQVPTPKSTTHMRQRKIIFELPTAAITRSNNPESANITKPVLKCTPQLGQDKINFQLPASTITASTKPDNTCPSMSRSKRPFKITQNLKDRNDIEYFDNVEVEDHSEEIPMEFGGYMSEEEFDLHTNDLWQGYMDLGMLDKLCPYCKAIMWNNGRNKKSNKHVSPTFSVYCRNGQLYVYDTENEIENRKRAIPGSDSTDSDIVKGADGRSNNVGPSNEVGALIVGDLEDSCGTRDIVVQTKTKQLQRIFETNAHSMPLQYPLLFPHGDEGFHLKIPLMGKNGGPPPKIIEGDDDGEESKQRCYVSMREYYAYKFMIRLTEGLTPHLSGRLWQQYIVDAFTAFEQYRLEWIKRNQKTIRSDLYNSIRDSLRKVMYVIEFHKRGLPHAHMLIWLHPDDRPNMIEQIDDLVCAEIPHKETDPAGYNAVKNYMIHGSCGKDFSYSPCMSDGKCGRQFPKRYNGHTFFDDFGFPVYRWRRMDRTVEKNKQQLDNQFIVPYNRDLLLRFQCHMNLEICNNSLSSKYLFKYCLKGHDTIIMMIRRKKRLPLNSEKGKTIDEVRHFPDDRYVCASEVAWTLLGYDIHYRYPSIERFPVHVEGGKNVTFNVNDTLDEVATKASNRKSSTSFRDLRTINGRTYNTYKEACEVLGLLKDDNQWHSTLRENTESGMPFQLRSMFVHILTNCPVADQLKLWTDNLKFMSDDILYNKWKNSGNVELKLSDADLENYTLVGIKHGSDIAELIKNTSLVIWDEAPMQHRHGFEYVDRCFRDIMASAHPRDKNILFGGITSSLWNHCKVFMLHQNMRLGCGMNAEENQKIAEFAKWVLDVGDGKVENIHPDNIYKDPEIIIPRKYLVEKKTNAVKDIVDVTYPDFTKNYTTESYLKEGAILTPTNAIVDEVNSHVLNLIPGITHSYLSQDSIDTETGYDDNDYESSFPIEYLNSINMPSILKHDLKLKIEDVVMLMRNLNQIMGLCNGTRMVLTKYLKNNVEYQLLT
ncbi:uncharacterized protein LOC141719046 [Apium graveolens]|uniref:uncharacterized protein LOC141719046 n=1 Tax=Apium graveolens TaxID=4045 RepID=UPI003D7B0666